MKSRLNPFMDIVLKPPRTEPRSGDRGVGSAASRAFKKHFSSVIERKKVSRIDAFSSSAADAPSERGNQPRRAGAVGNVFVAELRAQQRLFRAHA